MSLRATVAILAWIAFSKAHAHEKFDSLALTRKAQFAIHNYLSNPDLSITEAKQVLDAGVELRSTYFQGYAYFLLAKSHWAKGSLGSSTEFGFKALRVLENSAYEQLTGEVLLVLARTLTELKNYN